ncbi:MAG: PspC domain-containing protein [Chlamydiae bacterium]|nr:PspC domain-containing protein [Chlamydiota bacterium]
MPGKKLYRSKIHRKFLGVCGGLGEFFSIDPTIVRIICIGLALTTFIVPVTVSYAVGAFILPENPDQ